MIHPNIKESDVVIIRSYTDGTPSEEITLECAIFSLANFWKKDAIEPMLLNGQTLFTPFAEYRMKKSKPQV